MPLTPKDRPSSTILSMQSFRAALASSDNAPENHLWFDLVTGERDTFKTRLNPAGARFHSEARPWLDTHFDKSAAKVIGNMVDSRLADNLFQVLVKFDSEDPEAMKIYDKHKRGIVRGCSVGFLPIPGKSYVKIEDDGQKTIVYDEFYILEGSSCGVPSNPTALMRSADDAITQLSGETPYDALINDKALDIVEEEAFLQQFPGAKTASKEELLDAFVAFKRGSTTRSAGAAVKPTPSKIATRDALTVGAIPSKVFSTTVQGKQMTPEQRAMHRAMIGETLRAAEDHMAARAAMAEFPEHQEFHAGEARAAMTRCGAMCRMVHNALHEAGEPTPDIAPNDAKVGALMRSAAPAGTDAELAKEWDVCRRSAALYGDLTFRDVGERIAKSPKELRVKWTAATAIEALHRKALAEKRNAAETLEMQQRTAIIEELKAGPGLEPAIECEILGLDPSDPTRQTRSGEPWSLTDLQTLRTQLIGAATVLTRTASLTAADPDPTATTNELHQGAPAQRSAGQAAGLDPKVRAAIEAGLRSTGMNSQTALAAARRLS